MENGGDITQDKHWYYLGQVQKYFRKIFHKNKIIKYNDYQGMYEDLKQRIPYYLSDFYDGFAGDKTVQKTISATIFLYFACILPAIAFGVLNLHNTGEQMNRN